jgi:hypothetical protein
LLNVARTTPLSTTMVRSDASDFTVSTTAGAGGGEADAAGAGDAAGGEETGFSICVGAD